MPGCHRREFVSNMHSSKCVLPRLTHRLQKPEVAVLMHTDPISPVVLAVLKHFLTPVFFHSKWPKKKWGQCYCNMMLRACAMRACRGGDGTAMEGWGESKEPNLVQSLVPSRSVTEVEPPGTAKFSPTRNQLLWSKREAGYEATCEQCAQQTQELSRKLQQTHPIVAPNKSTVQGRAWYHPIPSSRRQ